MAHPDDYEGFLRALKGFIPDARLISDPLRTLTYGTDASLYRLIPRLVVRVDSEEEMSRILPLAHRHRVPVTLRAAGTSLSGQAVTDSVLLLVGDQWRRWRIADDASRISLQPAVLGGHANRLLAPHGRKIGPDPASLNACHIGGIAANNASGMCCGTAQNSYRTLESMRVILPDGTLLDTADTASREAFERTHGELLQALRALGERTRNDRALADRIREKFRIKNTCGYSLNALVDFEDPIDILQHLMIGSEGTLGFIAEITYRTVEDPKDKATALILFPDIASACHAIGIIKPLPVAAAELMDRASLQSVEDKPGVPPVLKELGPDAAALLVETRAGDHAVLAEQVETIRTALDEVETLEPIQFSMDRGECDRLWAIRSGLFPSVGSMRRNGTTVIIEDVAVAVPRLAALTLDLQDLFRRHGYEGTIIFGHALEGNLHFVLTPDLGHPETVERYRAFMDELSRMVVERHDGSLKAEHGTGRNMAPFVELEWGQQAYGLMGEIKRLFDPDNLMNPGVVLNDDPDIHTRNLKPMPAVDALVDKCIECGFCEPTCPSRSLTLTPRQRIVALREMERLEQLGEESRRLRRMRKLYRYQGLDTCAVDSLCALSCPVGIDTGKMVKQMRGRGWGPVAHRVSGWVARNFGPITSATRLSLGSAHLMHVALGTRAMSGLTGGMRRLSGGRVPLWNPFMPKAARQGNPPAPAGPWAPRVVYFPSCASRTMGPARGDPEEESLTVKTESLLRKAGYEVVYPDDGAALCCGQPFESKGFHDDAAAKLSQLEASLLRASRDGQDPVIFDTSPCAFRARRDLKASGLDVYDVADFLHGFVLDRLQISKVDETVALHPTCSTTKMGLQPKLKAIAEACAERVVVPAQVHCCGWSGDRGFTYPELNASALKDLRDALPADCTAGYSTSRTCEIGLSLHSGRHYRSIVYLLDRCSEARGED
ncbi:MAG: FAD-binding oxidoreductase, partial [Thioalkalivibrio sp.]|nr:FAD-binding oxidoreductase [Thioalkalivibrio sp.]